MILLLKLVSFAIWFIIMVFIIGAVFRRKRKPIKDFSNFFCKRTEDNRKFYTKREDWS